MNEYDIVCEAIKRRTAMKIVKLVVKHPATKKLLKKSVKRLIKRKR